MMQSYNGFGMPRPKDDAKKTRIKLIYINKKIGENLFFVVSVSCLNNKKNLILSGEKMNYN